MFRIITKEESKEQWKRYMKESTKNIRGMRRHANRKNAKLPLWMSFQHSLDSLNFNHMDFARLTGRAQKKERSTTYA